MHFVSTRTRILKHVEQIQVTEAEFFPVTFSQDWKRSGLVCKPHIDETMNVCLCDWPGRRVTAALNQSEKSRKHGEALETSQLAGPDIQGD